MYLVICSMATWMRSAAQKQRDGSSWPCGSVGPPASTATFKETLNVHPIIWSYIFCEKSFVTLHNQSQQSAKPEDKLERPIHLISTVPELMTSVCNTGHGSDQESDFAPAPDCKV